MNTVCKRCNSHIVKNDKVLCYDCSSLMQIIRLRNEAIAAMIDNREDKIQHEMKDYYSIKNRFIRFLFSFFKKKYMQMESVNDLLKIIKDFAENDNKKDGVEFIKDPDHCFRCLKCNKIHVLRYFAMKCCGKFYN